jgi:hypothetical protein
MAVPWWFACAVLAVAACGCAARGRTPSSASTPDNAVLVPQSSLATVAFPDRGGFQVSYDQDRWKSIDRGGDFVLALAPKDSQGAKDDPLIAIEVPRLPPHFPGFLPLGAVVAGYLRDLKARHPDRTVFEQDNVKLAGLDDARRVVCGFTKFGKPWREEALLAVHGDSVYVLVTNCAQVAFDKTAGESAVVESSLKWIGKS